MSVHHDRRDAKASRMPFEAIVEIGGELAPGAAFEAQSIDLSVSGMHLRTAYLPEIGQQLLCRFGSGAEDISAEAEVVWRREESRGGEFGVRFINLDGASAAALCQMCGVGQAEAGDADGDAAAQTQPGTRVRLHIDGLGSPMKARVRGATDAELLVGSNLEFLRVGRTLELEDVDRGGKRPAHIDRVDIEVDRDSQVPLLVVTLRYDDTSAKGGGAGPGGKEEGTPSGDAKTSASASDDTERAVALMRSRPMAELRRRYERARAKWTASTVAKGARRVQSGVSRWGVRARMTAGLLWERVVERSVGEKVAGARRMTSPPPSGALTAAGKRVVRAAAEEPEVKEPSMRGLGFGKRAIAIAMCSSALALVVLVVAIARKPRAASAPVADTVAGADPAMGNAAADGGVAPAAETQVATAETSHVEPVDDTNPSSASPNATLTPIPSFGSGKVSHAVIVQVKLDGSVAALHGTRTASGFAVTVPGRRTLDSAALLTRADPRFAAVKVANHAKSTELTFEFRGAVPSFVVRARGDRLQIALGPSDASASRSPVATRTSGTDHADERHRAAHPEASDVRAASKTSATRSHH